MSRYMAYQEYRDSGVVWLGRVPAHWVSKRFKQVLADKKKSFNPSLEAGSISFGRVVFKDSDNLSQETKDSYQEVLSGEYLVNPLNLNYDLLSLRTALSEIDVVVSTGYIVLKSTGVLKPRYIRWLLHEFDVSHMKTLGAGVRQTINYSDIGNSYFCAPMEAEQEAISTFLDHETAKIDALIEKQQRLIELLKEKRQAVISHAVTKGLNPNAPMKDSGVEWLGEVPAHWNMQKLAWRFTAKKGSNAAQLTKEFCASIEGEHPVYSGQTENSGVMACIDSYEFDAGEEGYLFSTTVGAKAMTVMHITGRFSLSQNCMVIIPCTAYSIPRFYYYHFQPLFSYERGLIPEHMQASFRMEDLYQYKVLEPPKSEQIEIANFLDVNTAVFDELISRSLNACLLLQERRTALISAAVTGKIDVRDWQAAV